MVIVKIIYFCVGMGLFPWHVIVDWLVTWRMSFFVFFYSPKPHHGHQTPVALCVLSLTPSSFKALSLASTPHKSQRSLDSNNWDHWYKVIESSTFNKTIRFSSFI